MAGKSNESMAIKKNSVVRKALPPLALAATLCGVSASQAFTWRVCPASGAGPQDPTAYYNQGSVDCWTGSSWATGTTWARGYFREYVDSPDSGRMACAYKFGSLDTIIKATSSWAQMDTFTAGGSPVSGCGIADYTADGQTWCNLAYYSACSTVSFYRLSAWGMSIR